MSLGRVGIGSLAVADLDAWLEAGQALPVDAFAGGASELEALGLYDPAAPDARERLELLEFLVGLGATPEELVAAGDTLSAVASTVVLRGGGARFRRAEAARRAGISVEEAIRFGRAAGLPDPGPDVAVYGEDDVELLRIFDAGSQLLGIDATMQLVRVIGSALARIADAEVATFLTNVGGPLMVSDPSGLELARANAAAATLLVEAGHAIDVLLRRHVEAAQRPLLPGSRDTVPIAVGFADLVGSTALGEDLSIAELGRMIAEFEERAVDTIVDAGGRAVKFNGDDVMFVASDPAMCCEIGLRLASQFSNDARLPPVRVGLAFGDVLTRDGDYFGPVVNLAARIIRLADPSEVVASAGVESVLADSDAFAFRSRGAQRLRGIREPIEVFTLERRTRSGTSGG
jgi:class 3 adenylate cyclase